MTEILLQFGTRSTGLLALALTMTTSILGLAVSYIAFRGYWRNRSLPMLFVATGFFFTFLTPVLLSGGFIALQSVAQFAPGMLGTVNVALAIAGEVSRIIGLLCILYGLRMPLSR